MQKDGMKFNNIVEWVATDKDGNVIGSGIEHNQVQTAALTHIVDQLDENTSSTAQTISGMGVGTSTGQNAAATELASLESAHDLASGEITQPTATSLKFSVSFTGIADTITEAGLFTATNCESGMYFYDDNLSQVLTADDTLTINWTVTLEDGN